MESELIMSTAQIEKAFEAWPQVEPTLRVPHNDREYRRLVKLLDRLVDEVGEKEKHPSCLTNGSDWCAYSKVRRRSRPRTGLNTCGFLMKNANIFIDVDLTLIDAKYSLIPGAREGLTQLKDERMSFIFLWSTNGADYARKIASLYHLTEMFEGFAAKPDIIIDDMPGTVLNPFVFDVNTELSWPALADKIIHKHID